MAEIKGRKKRLSIDLSFLNLTDSSKPQPSPQKSPKNFEVPNGVVGLGILAALTHNHDQDPIFIHGGRSPVLATTPKSTSKPIPINCNRKLSVEEMELCEEYTCVISHGGENLVKKRVYFEAEFLGENSGVKRVFDSSVNCGGETADFEVADFLSSCFLCDKMLHGMDIFMYRGDKAFCSAECRCRQISIDEQKERRRLKKKPMEYSVSPCSGALQFLAGVAAA